MNFPRRTYGTLLSAWAALNLPRYALRALQGRRVPIRARLDPDQEDGLSHPATPRAEWILHACSVGEIEAVRPLYDAVSRTHPTLVTVITDTGLAAARRADLPSAYLPFDLAGPVRKGLARHFLRGFVILETEIWPNLILALSEKNIPTYLVSGRISDRALPRYRKVRRLLMPVLDRIQAIGAQCEADAERFVSIGVPRERVHVTGNLKADRNPPPPPDWPIPGRGTPDLLVAGSTHAEEEEALLAAFVRLRAEGGGVRLLIAPRHLERMNEIEANVRAQGLSVGRRSRAENDFSVWAAACVLLDTHGELSASYGLSTLAFVGGTISPVGGHNPLEAARAGALVLHGPHVQNARKSYEILDAAGAKVVRSSGEIVDAWRKAILDPLSTRRAGAALASAAARESGALGRTLALIGLGGASRRGT